MIDAATVEAVVTRGCISKTALSERAARRVCVDVAADSPGEDGHPPAPYPCPFAGRLGLPAHWHVGHTPSIESLELTAAAIRFLAVGDLPDALASAAAAHPWTSTTG